MESSEVPDNWVDTISNESWKEIASKLVILSLQIPHLRSKVLDLVWLICVEDKKEIKEVGNMDKKKCDDRGIETRICIFRGKGTDCEKPKNRVPYDYGTCSHQVYEQKEVRSNG